MLVPDPSNRRMSMLTTRSLKNANYVADQFGEYLGNIWRIFGKIFERYLGKYLMNIWRNIWEIFGEYSGNILEIFGEYFGSI